MPTAVQVKTGAQNTGLSTVTATLDSAATVGNLLVLIVGADDYRSGVPTGYTESAGAAQETFLGHYLWWKVAAGGETSAAYTIGSAAPSAWLFAEFPGIAASPYDVSGGQLAQSSGTSYTTATITPSAGSRMLIASIGGSLNGTFSEIGRAHV